MSYECPHDPETHGNLGMYHCPDCGLMVLGGLAHPGSRRFRPRLHRDDPWVDISDSPDQWTDRDEFDYADDPAPDRESPGDAR
jgi:hypothetical protein